MPAEAGSIDSLPPYPEDGLLHAASDQQHEKFGTVIRMGWSKTPESYKAGGSHYYILVEDSSTPSSSSDRLILRTTKTVPNLEMFLPFEGKRVVARGRYAAYHKMRADPFDQHIAIYRSSDQQYWQRFGGGFLVDSIELVVGTDRPSP